MCSVYLDLYTALQFVLGLMQGSTVVKQLYNKVLSNSLIHENL